jgi:hypothetical protein
VQLLHEYFNLFFQPLVDENRWPIDKYLQMYKSNVWILQNFKFFIKIFLFLLTSRMKILYLMILWCKIVGCLRNNLFSGFSLNF